MSSKERQFVAFAEFEPDTVEFDNSKLDVAENVTPSYGAYRPIEKLTKLTELSDTNPLSGGYAHLTGQPTPNINLFPSREGFTSPAMVGNWYVKDMVKLDDADIENYGVDQVTGPAINDTTWIRTPPMNEGAGGGTLFLRFPETPRIPVSTDDFFVFKIRFRLMGELLSDDTHRFDWILNEEGVGAIKSGTWTYTASDNDWEVLEFTLTGVQIGNISDWSQLEIKLLAESDIDVTGTEVNNVPLADEYYDTGWGQEDGDTEDMFESVDNYIAGIDAVPDYSTYVDSGPIPPDGESTIIFRYDEIPLPSDPETFGHTFMAWYTASKNNVSIKMRVLQADSPSDDEDAEDFWTFSGQEFRILYEKEVNSISTDQSTPVVTELLDTPTDGYDWSRGADPSKFVYAAFTVKYAGGGGGTGATAYMVPTTEHGNSSWTAVGSDKINNVTTGDESDADDSKTISNNHTGSPDTISLNMSDGPQATERTHNSHVVHVRAQGVSGTSIKITLAEGNEEIDSSPHNQNSLNASWAWHTLKLSAGRAAAIGTYNDLRVKIAAGGEGLVEVSEVYFSYPGDSASARLYETFIKAERGAHFEISDLRIELTDPKNSNLGDLNEIYVGTETDLYEVTSIGFTDVTRAAGDYGDAALPDVPKLWSFTSWGDDVIATNFADIVQRRVVGATKFTNLVHADSPYAPQGRFAAVVGASLVLADISPSNYASRPYTDGKPYHLWSSYLLQPDYFDVADYDNQSAIFPLISKPGAITGLVGGESGWVFKRNSIWQMRYVGLPPIFQFDLVAEGVGCSHPQSIVSAGGDVYFWGGGSIQRVGPNGYERLSGLRVEKYLFDTGFEELGIYNRYGSDTRENDALVWGVYDAYSGLIWWLYRTIEDGQYRLNHAVIYSIIEDRFTTVSDQDLDFTLLLGQQNVVTNEPVLNRSILGFRNTDTTTEYVKFQGDQTYSGTLKTKILTPTSWDYPVGRDADLVAVRPMYTSQPSVTDNYQPTELPDFKITIVSAQDPALRVDRRTEVVRRIREDRQGWIPVDPMVGEFWQFEVEYPELSRSTIKEFLGLQLMVNQRGDG